MVLNIEDVQIRARRCPINAARVRLTIEYPRTPEYRDKINNALADLLRPPSTAATADIPQIEGTEQEVPSANTPDGDS